MMEKPGKKTLAGTKKGTVAKEMTETEIERLIVMAEEEKDDRMNGANGDKLAATLDAVEKVSHLNFTDKPLGQILGEVHQLLATARVAYPAPNRVSLSQTIQLVREFTNTWSGEDRTKAVCTALLRTIAREFGVFDEASREKDDAGDPESEVGGDIECRLSGRIVLQVEVRDRSLTMTQLNGKLDTARARRISEILFLTEHGIEEGDRSVVEKRITGEYVSGQNIYVSNFVDFSAGILILLGEKGRVEFLRAVGEELDRTGSPITHRQAWVQLLKSL